MAKEQIKDGGPAFPETILEGNPQSDFMQQVTAGGMTLRDYFAAHALASMNSEDYNGATWADDMAGHAYKVADAMIAARDA